MKTVWKYTIQDGKPVEMPEGASVLKVELQRSELQMWVLVDPRNETELRTFKVMPTGGHLPDDGVAHVGTILIHDGALVYHVFEVAK